MTPIFSRVNMQQMTVTYRVALKAPGGTKYIQLPLSGQIEADINDWLGTVLHQRKWKHHLLYNDEPPHEAASNGGHCKGVLVWDDRRVGWLVHSTPKWPAEFSNPLPTIDASQTEYGQSFVYMETTVDALDSILMQIALMGAHVYAGAPLAKNTAICNHIELAHGVCWHVAKSPAHHIDFYDSYLTQFLGGSLTCQTWGRPLLDSTDNVKNIRRMQWAPTEPEYTTRRDHSKFAVSMDWRCPRVYIGDLNHMQSQEHRGGGGFVIHDYALWQSFNDIILDYTVVVPNKQNGPIMARIWARMRRYCC